MALHPARIIARIQRAMRDVGGMEEALLAAVRTTCISCQIPYGEVWTNYTGRRILYLKAAWYPPDLDFSTFEAASRKFALAPGVGMAGKVWQSRQSEVIEDIRAKPDFSRQSIALDAGFRSVVGSPVFCGDELVAVLVFLMLKRERKLSGLIDRIAGAAGAELSEHRLADRSGSVDAKASLVA